MKLQKLILAGVLSIGTGLGLNAQIIVTSSSGDTQLWGVTDHTGLAIAPGPGSLDVQAAVYSDASGDYFIEWIESFSGNTLDDDQQMGSDPDVVYGPDESELAVVYENSGVIYIDEYQLASVSPLDYALGTTIGVSTGQYPNIDITSSGYGIVTWEDGGDIFVAPYIIGSGIGPVLYAGSGTQPDIIVQDNTDLATITYIDNNGDLFIESLLYFDLFGGNYVSYTNWTYSPINIYEFPRIASNKNDQYGPYENFTVVVQDYNTLGSASVDAFFSTNVFSMNGPVVVNPDFASCGGDWPLPVVAYQRGRVRIAWSQTHLGGCTSLVQSPFNPTGIDDDVFVRLFNQTGTASGDYQEVNNWQSFYSSYSRTSIASRKDGVYGVNNTNYQGGILFSDQGDLFWKAIYPGNTTYMDEAGLTTDRNDNFSLVTSPVGQTIEVLSESDDEVTFQLLDNAGRIVDLKSVSNNGNTYSIDISHLSGGMYFLNCTSNAGEEVLRVLQITK